MKIVSPYIFELYIDYIMNTGIFLYIEYTDDYIIYGVDWQKKTQIAAKYDIVNDLYIIDEFFWEDYLVVLHS